MKSDDEILSELARAAEGLLMMSESDHPLEPFSLEATAGGPGHSRLRELAGATADARVEVTTPEKFFAVAAGEQAWKGEAELATARRFRRLLRVLETGLSDLRVYRVGEINVAVYVLGRSPSGGWLGLSTRVVET